MTAPETYPPSRPLPTDILRSPFFLPVLASAGAGFFIVKKFSSDRKNHSFGYIASEGIKNIFAGTVKTDSK